MRKDEQIKIQYAAKYASISNAWKKWQGEVLGLTRTNAVEKKKTYEAEFQKRVNANPQWKDTIWNYVRVTSSLLIQKLKPLAWQEIIIHEIISKIELFTIAAQLNALSE